MFYFYSLQLFFCNKTYSTNNKHKENHTVLRLCRPIIFLNTHTSRRQVLRPKICRKVWFRLEAVVMLSLIYRLIFWSCICVSVSANVDSGGQNQQSWIPPGGWAERDGATQHRSSSSGLSLPPRKQTIDIYATDVSVEILMIGPIGVKVVLNDSIFYVTVFFLRWQYILRYVIYKLPLIFVRGANVWIFFSHTVSHFQWQHWWTVNSISHINVWASTAHLILMTHCRYIGIGASVAYTSVCAAVFNQ